MPASQLEGTPSGRVRSSMYAGTSCAAGQKTAVYGVQAGHPMALQSNNLICFKVKGLVYSTLRSVEKFLRLTDSNVLFEDHEDPDRVRLKACTTKCNFVAPSRE